MIKESTSLHRIPYFDLVENALTAVDKDKIEYHDVMCVCPPDSECETGNRPNQAGYKYQFNYPISPTIEPISYKLKGYKWNAGLTFNDITSDSDGIKDDIMSEISAYMSVLSSDLFSGGGADIPEIVSNFENYEQNVHDNQSLSNKIFQKMKRYEQKDEVYSPTDQLDNVCMGVNINSTTYIVTAKFTKILWF